MKKKKYIYIYIYIWVGANLGPILFGRPILVKIQQHAWTKVLYKPIKKLFQNVLTVINSLPSKKKKHNSLEILFDSGIKRLVFLLLWVETIEIVAYDWIILRVSFYLLELTQFCKAHAWRRVINGGTHMKKKMILCSGADGFEAYVWGDT